jgi:hypothetical protein
MIAKNNRSTAIQNLPDTAASAQRAARLLGFTITDPCMPGVLANLALLRRHADILTQNPG